MSFDNWEPDPRYTGTSPMVSAIVTIWDAVNDHDGDIEAAIESLDDDLDMDDVSDLMETYVRNRTVWFTRPAWEVLRYRRPCCTRFTLRSYTHDCGNCSECCECPSCMSCGERSINNCSRCDVCSDCCSCASCSRCGNRFESVCESCDRCEDCCRCSDNLRSRTEGRPWLALDRKERLRFKSSRLCGIEWEINEVEDAEPVERWAGTWRGGIHTDSSCGWECVTAPLAGDYVRRCVLDLGRALEKASATVDSNCGVHVHVDARDLFWPDIFRLMAVHAHIEPILYVLAGQKRAQNDYCKPAAEVFGDSLGRLDRKGATLSLAGDTDFGPNEGRGRREARSGIDKKSGGRYRSLNIVPWLARQSQRRAHDKLTTRARDSTVEFRMHRDTYDADRVASWAELCVRIVDWVARATDAEADALSKMSALRALVTIAPESREWIMCRIAAWRRSTSPRRRVFTVALGQWVHRSRIRRAA